MLLCRHMALNAAPRSVGHKMHQQRTLWQGSVLKSLQHGWQGRPAACLWQPQLHGVGLASEVILAPPKGQVVQWEVVHQGLRTCCM